MMLLFMDSYLKDFSHYEHIKTFVYQHHAQEWLEEYPLEPAHLKEPEPTTQTTTTSISTWSVWESVKARLGQDTTGVAVQVETKSTTSSTTSTTTTSTWTMWETVKSQTAGLAAKAYDSTQALLLRTRSNSIPSN